MNFSHRFSVNLPARLRKLAADNGQVSFTWKDYRRGFLRRVFASPCDVHGRHQDIVGTHRASYYPYLVSHPGKPVSNNRAKEHYAGSDTGDVIAARMLAALRGARGDVPVTPEALEPLDHFNARGVAATKELAALLDPQPGETILDIGSGIGGPARWIAGRYGCSVTGVDITSAFCDAARALNEVCGMTDRVLVLEGSATALPLSDASFNRAYSHGVIMSVADKIGFFQEALRVLKPGGAPRPVPAQRRGKWATRLPCAVGRGSGRQLPLDGR